MGIFASIIYEMAQILLVGVLGFWGGYFEFFVSWYLVADRAKIQGMIRYFMWSVANISLKPGARANGFLVGFWGDFYFLQRMSHGSLRDQCHDG